MWKVWFTVENGKEPAVGCFAKEYKSKSGAAKFAKKMAEKLMIQCVVSQENPFVK